MNYEWDLRLELLEISHRWLYVFLAFLLGSGLGWLLSLVLPTSYHAESEVYVAYSADAIYRNPDDYKNWQLGELEVFIYSEPVLQEVLGRLQSQDSYWDAWTTARLRDGLDAYWRNAGKWRLVAEVDHPDQAEELALIWRNVTLEKAHHAIEQSQLALFLGEQIRALSLADVRFSQQQAVILQSSSALRTWAANPPAQASMTTLEHWRLQQWAAQAIQTPALAAGLLEGMPLEQSDILAYQAWAEQAAAALEQQLTSLQNQQQELQLQRAALETRWQEATKTSFNLTAWLMIEPIRDVRPTSQPVRVPGQMAAVGGVIGVLAWIFVWLGRPLRRISQ